MVLASHYVYDWKKFISLFGQSQTPLKYTGHRIVDWLFRQFPLYPQVKPPNCHPCLMLYSLLFLFFFCCVSHFLILSTIVKKNISWILYGNSSCLRDPYAHLYPHRSFPSPLQKRISANTSHDGEGVSYRFDSDPWSSQKNQVIIRETLTVNSLKAFFKAPYFEYGICYWLGFDCWNSKEIYPSLWFTSHVI